MATTQLPPAAQPASPKPDHHDDHSGAFGFFRKYQKAILYSAGLFALLTFSVTGAMLGMFDQLSQDRRASGSIEVNGKRVELQAEDHFFGTMLAANRNAVMTVLPNLDTGEAGDSRLSEIYAWLRRAAIADGIDVSSKEVDAAIDYLREAYGAADRRQFAAGFTRPGTNARMSLAELRSVVREGMRIGNYVRLHSLSADMSDAAVLRELLDGKEKITLKVATFDQKKLAEDLKKNGALGEDELRKWLDGKTDLEKATLQVFDTNRVKLDLGLAAYAEFDPAEWTEELKNLQLGDEQLKSLYEEEKANRFAIEGKENEFRPFEEQAVKDELTKLRQVDEVLNVVARKIREAQDDAVKPLVDEVQKTTAAWIEAQKKRDEAKKLADAKPDDAALQQAAKQAEDDVTAKEAAKKAADEARVAGRAAFDFKAKFAELTANKKGFSTRSTQDSLGSKQLRELSTVKDASGKDLELGKWPGADAVNFGSKGELGSVPARAAKAGFLWRLTDVVQRPLKEWTELKPLLETAYFEEQAKKQAEEKKKLFEETMLRLAKAKIPDKVAEIEAKRAPEIDRQLAEWEKQTGEKRTAAEASLRQHLAGSQAHAAWQKELENLDAQIAKKDEKRKEIEGAVAKTLDAEIETEAKKQYGAVLEQAAQEAGFAVATHGPFPRDLTMIYRQHPKERFGATVAFLFGSAAKDLKVGEASAVLEDPTEKKWHLAYCEKVEPMTAADVTRREFMERRDQPVWSFAKMQAQTAISQSFTHEALKARLKVQAPGGEQ